MRTKRINRKVYYVTKRIGRFKARNLKILQLVLGFTLAVFTILSGIALFLEPSLFKKITDNIFVNFPSFISYFFDVRSIIFYSIIVILLLSKEYYKYESKILEYTLEKKKEIALKLHELYDNPPGNHYMGLILGKLGTDAIQIMNQHSKDIIDKIDINIKKHEQVYWISESELGVLFYEAIIDGQKKSPEFFVNTILKNKLSLELEDDIGQRFHEDISFSWIELGSKEDLHEAEFRVRNNGDTIFKKKVVEE